jgi:hypothetical protein
MMHAPIMAANPLRPIPLITAQVHERDEVLFALLTKPAPLTKAEWVYVEEAERRAA